MCIRDSTHTIRLAAHSRHHRRSTGDGGAMRANAAKRSRHGIIPMPKETHRGDGRYAHQCRKASQ
eukprot:5960414-Pyramimonas_sp.AAC.1